MDENEEIRRFHREATRLGPGSWAVILAILGLVGAQALLEGSGPFFWFHLVLFVGICGSLVVALLLRGRRLRTTPPVELRRKTIESLRQAVSNARLTLVLACVMTAIAVVIPLVDWIRGEDPARFPTPEIQIVLAVSFWHQWAVLVPRARRLLASLPPSLARIPDPTPDAGPAAASS